MMWPRRFAQGPIALTILLQLAACGPEEQGADRSPSKGGKPSIRQAIEESLVTEFSDKERQRIGSLREQYKLSFTRSLIEHGTNGVFTKEHLIRYVEASQSMKRAYIVNVVLNHDFDGDGELDAGEIEALSSRSDLSNNYFRDLDMHLRRWGIEHFSWREILDYADQESRKALGRTRALGHPGELLGLDANGDESVDLEEVLEGVDRLADEWTHSDVLGKTPRSKADEYCEIPLASNNNVILLISSSGAQSTSGTADDLMSDVAGSVRLQIEDGADSLFVVAVSQRPLAWRVEGAVHRVSHLAVSAHSNVIGLGKDKVTVLEGQKCVGHFDADGGPRLVHSQAFVAVSQGRFPDRIVAADAADTIGLPHGQIATGERPVSSKGAAH